jgi:hypothetical protein
LAFEELMQIGVSCWKCQASRQVAGDHFEDPRQQLIGVFDTLAALSVNGLMLIGFSARQAPKRGSNSDSRDALTSTRKLVRGWGPDLHRLGPLPSSRCLKAALSSDDWHYFTTLNSRGSGNGATFYHATSTPSPTRGSLDMFVKSTSVAAVSCAILPVAVLFALTVKPAGAIAEPSLVAPPSTAAEAAESVHVQPRRPGFAPNSAQVDVVHGRIAIFNATQAVQDAVFDRKLRIRRGC